MLQEPSASVGVTSASVRVVSRRDLVVAAVIGALVGLLSQPIFATLALDVSGALRIAAFFGFFLLAPIALAVAAFLARFWTPLYQFAKFAAVGVLNTFMDLGLLNLEGLLFGIPDKDMYPLYKGISFLFAVTNSFFWNKLWVFQARETSVRQTFSFYAVAVVGFIVNVTVASVVVRLFALPEVLSLARWGNIGALVGVFAGLAVNYMGYKFLVFRGRQT